jgi:hypothetical protein
VRDSSTAQIERMRNVREEGFESKMFSLSLVSLSSFSCDGNSCGWVFIHEKGARDLEKMRERWNVWSDENMDGFRQFK